METSITVERAETPVAEDTLEGGNSIDTADKDEFPESNAVEEDLPSKKKTRGKVKKKNKNKKNTAKPRISKHKCKECGRVCPDKASLANHVQIHNPESPFACPQCPYRGKTKKYVARHVKRVHGGPPTGHVCGYCGKTFHFRSNLLAHERVHTGAKPNKCDVCGKDFSSLYSLHTHKLIHTDEKPFKCTYCDYACRDTSTLRKHKGRHLGTLKMHHCEYCPASYDNMTRMREHVREVHTQPEVRPHKCHECGAAFKQKAVLRKHKETVHDRTKTCVCSICKRTLSSYNNLKSHLRRHLEARPYKCAAAGCGSSFKDRHGLKKHSAIHDMSLHVICDTCGRAFSRKSRLATHIANHRPRVKREECARCGIRFYTKQYLKKHMEQKHARKRQQYMCDMCDFVTHNKPSLVMHIKHGHSKEKGKCEVCGKLYKLRHQLRQHYWSAHSLRVATSTQPASPPEEAEAPAVQVKVEPVEHTDELEFDLLDIEKEEPFAGFESSECFEEAPHEGAGHPLHQFLTRVENGDELETEVSFNPTDPSNNEELNEHTATQTDSDTPQQREVSVDVSIQPLKTTKSDKNVVQTRKSTRNDQRTETIDNWTGVERSDDVSHPETSFSSKTIYPNQTSNSERRKQEFRSKAIIYPRRTSKEDEEETSTDVMIVEETAAEVTVAEEMSEEIPEEIAEEIPEEMAEETAEGAEERTSMPVDEFIQQVMGESVQETQQDDTMIVDEEAEADVERKLRELLVKMNRTHSGKVGAAGAGRRRVRVLTPLEIAEAHNRQLREEEEANARSDESGSGGDDDDDNDEDYDGGDGKKDGQGQLRMIWNMHQCYVCFKLFESKPQLIDHCKSHFDVCNEITLKKCPLCPYVTTKSDIKRHLKVKHKQNVDISFMNIKDKRDNTTGSRYYYDTKNDSIKELEIIPSIKILNKKASMELDKKNREMKNKFVGKPKLVRKGKEWIVVKEKLDLTNHVLPEIDKNCDNYLEVIKKLGVQAKRKGVQMLYPCNRCEKVCQNLSALTLHSRRHDPNPKPFKRRGYKAQVTTKPVTLNTKNRTAKPKPIVNNHKCDPKLMDFYEKNIKGGDIEFWQFLKIYNKMNKEQVNTFQDLETRTEFGIHYNDASNSDLNTANTDTGPATNDIIKNTSKNLTKKRKNRDVPKTGLIGNRKFINAIKLTKLEYNKREEVKNRMRQQIADGQSS